MNSLNKLLGHVAVLLLFVCHFEGVAQEEKKPMTIDQLAWLTGSWQGPLDGGILEETWLSPKSETISALVRYTKKGKTEFVEIIKKGIEKSGGGWGEPPETVGPFYGCMFCRHWRKLWRSKN